MRIYDTTKDEYGYPLEIRDYLVDRGMSTSGTKAGILMEIRVWNFVARIINRLKQI